MIIIIIILIILLFYLSTEKLFKCIELFYSSICFCKNYDCKKLKLFCCLIWEKEEKRKKETSVQDENKKLKTDSDDLKGKYNIVNPKLPPSISNSEISQIII